MSIRFSIKILSFLLVCLYASSTTQAQIKRANSPYSYFGIGDLEPTSFGMNKAVGGLSNSLRSAININLSNPASLSAIKRTTLETAFDANIIGLNNGTQTQRMSDAGISYLALAVPVTKFWGSSVGILPYSSVYYNIFDTQEVQNIGSQNFSHQGVGSLYQFYWGNGFNYKTISAGINMAYVFGNIERNMLTTYPNQSNIVSYNINEKSQIGGLTWNTGLQFHPKLSDKLQLTLGLTMASASQINQDITSETTTVQDFIVIQNVGDPLQDSLALVQIIDARKIDLPNKFGFGATINSGGTWFAGFDVEMANWQTTNLSDKNAQYTNTLAMKVGAAFIPYQQGFTSFINQTQFRLGAYYNNNYFKTRIAQTNNFEDINQFGFTFGAGFPLGKRSTSRFNVAFDVGQRGTISNDLLRETYFKANIGVTLNDIWFIKPKYD